MANRRFTQFYYTLHNKCVQLDCNFIVDSANANGLGIRSLKGPGIANVFMHTSAPLSGSGNPNPAAGVIIMQLQDNYQRYYFGSAGFVSPVSGTPIVVTSVGAHLVIGTPYVITTVGTTTAAEWVTLGLPIGITAAVGVSFIAAATGAGAGTGVVEVTAATGSGVDHVELIGNPNLTINSKAPVIQGLKSGSYIMMQTMSAGSRTAPADETVVSLVAGLSSTIITQAGE